VCVKDFPKVGLPLHHSGLRHRFASGIHAHKTPESP
jgi:hypothetical protein